MAVKVSCHKCQMTFWTTDEFHKTAVQMAESLTFYCPAGHAQHYVSGESPVSKLRRERDRAVQNAAYEADIRRQAVADADAAKRSAAAYKGAATRMKNRAKAGVCPCCNRTFQNLARHMKSQHPDADNVVEFGQESAKA